MGGQQPGEPAGGRAASVGTGPARRGARLVAALCQPAPGWWPASVGWFAALCGAAGTTVVVVVLGGTRQQDACLAAFSVVTAAVAVRSVPLSAPGIALIAWMFDNGFLVNRHAHLAWHGAADGIRLGVLLAAAIAGAVFGWYIRPRTPRAGSPPCPDAGEDQVLTGLTRGPVVDLAQIRDRRAAARNAAAWDDAAGDHEEFPGRQVSS